VKPVALPANIPCTDLAERSLLTCHYAWISTELPLVSYISLMMDWITIAFHFPDWCSGN